MASGVRVRERQVDVGRKLTLVRDFAGLTFEDDQGLAGDRKDKKIVELPIPDTGFVDDYKEQLTSRKQAFSRPVPYIRRPARTPFYEDALYAEYDLEIEDVAWLQGHVRWGSNADESVRLPSASFEWLLTIMERISGVRGSAAEAAGQDRVSKAEMEKGVLEHLLSETYKSLIKLPEGLNPQPSSGSSYKACFGDVYDYWLSKRKKLGKPLLRRFWPVTNSGDNNPHHTFRPHEKTIKVRRTRRNDADAVRKLSLMTVDLKQANKVLSWVKEREALKKAFFEVRDEMLFGQALAELCAVDGQPKRIPPVIEPTRKLLDRITELVPKLKLKPSAHPGVAGAALRAGMGAGPMSGKVPGPGGEVGPGGAAGNGMGVPSGAGAEMVEVTINGQKQKMSKVKYEKLYASENAGVKKPRPAPGTNGADGTGTSVAGIADSQHVQNKKDKAKTSSAPVEPAFAPHAAYPPFKLGPWTPPSSLSLHGPTVQLHTEEASGEPEEPFWLSWALGLKGFLPAYPTAASNAISRLPVTQDVLPSGNDALPYIADRYIPPATILSSRLAHSVTPLSKDEGIPAVQAMAQDLYYADLSIQRKFYHLRTSAEEWAGGLAWEEALATGLAAGIGGGVRSDGSGWETIAQKLERSILPGDSMLDEVLVDELRYIEEEEEQDEGAQQRKEGEGDAQSSSSTASAAHDTANGGSAAGVGAGAASDAMQVDGQGGEKPPAPASSAPKQSKSRTQMLEAAASQAFTRLQTCLQQFRKVKELESTNNVKKERMLVEAEIAFKLATEAEKLHDARLTVHYIAKTLRERRRELSAMRSAAERGDADAFMEALHRGASTVTRFPSIEHAAQQAAGIASANAEDEPVQSQVQGRASTLAREAAGRKRSARAMEGDEDNEEGTAEGELTYRFRLGRGGRMIVDRLPIAATTVRAELAPVMADNYKTLLKRRVMVKAQRAGILRQWGLPASSEMMDVFATALPSALTLQSAYMQTIGDGGSTYSSTRRFGSGDVAQLRTAGQHLQAESGPFATASRRTAASTAILQPMLAPPVLETESSSSADLAPVQPSGEAERVSASGGRRLKLINGPAVKKANAGLSALFSDDLQSLLADAGMDDRSVSSSSSSSASLASGQPVTPSPPVASGADNVRWKLEQSQGEVVALKRAALRFVANLDSQPRLPVMQPRRAMLAPSAMVPSSTVTSQLTACTALGTTAALLPDSKFTDLVTSVHGFGDDNGDELEEVAYERLLLRAGGVTAAAASTAATEGQLRPVIDQIPLNASMMQG